MTVSFIIIYRSQSSHSGPNQPLVIILFPDGNLKTNLGETEMGPYDILPTTWQHNELFVKDDRVLVMHFVPTFGRVVYATNLQLQQLWNLKLDQAGTYNGHNTLHIYE